MGERTYGRDLAIDATRGLAIWSMISLHFADGYKIAAPTHAFPYVDGLSAFVLLSGLVLGIVYRRWTDRHGLRFAYARLGGRLLTLYLAQVAISLVAVLVRPQLTGGQFWMLAVLDPNVSLGQQLWWALTLRWLPSGGSILVLYLVLMASVVVLLPIVRSRWGGLAVLGVSLALYVGSQLASWPWAVLHSSPGGASIADVAAWQVLFVPALVVGWQWSTWRLPERVDTALPALVALAAAAWLCLLPGAPLADWIHGEPALSSKVHLGPVRALAAWLVVACVYAVFRRLLQWMRNDWLRPLVMVGSRSLDAYVVQAAALLAVPTWIVFRPWGAVTSSVIVLALFALCWGWAECRSRWGIDKLHRAPVVVVRRLSRGWSPDRRIRWRSGDQTGTKQRASASAP